MDLDDEVIEAYFRVCRIFGIGSHVASRSFRGRYLRSKLTDLKVTGFCVKDPQIEAEIASQIHNTFKVAYQPALTQG